MKKTEQNLFEYLQEDLEKHTNYLSELYEFTLDVEDQEIKAAHEQSETAPIPVVDVTQELIMSLVETDDKKTPKDNRPQQPSPGDDQKPARKASGKELADFLEWKGKVSTYTKACLTFLDNLNEGIAGGLIAEGK